MNPRAILIKSQNKEFIHTLLFKLKEMKQIRFFHFKCNGFYTITIQCYNYYDRELIFHENQLYGNYIFLYSILSILLSDLLLLHYEHRITHRMLHLKDFTPKELSKLSSISALLLDEESPFEFSKVLYTKRKQIVLTTLLHHFRKHNYIFVDHFLDFNAGDYKTELSKIIEASLEILKDNALYHYMMRFIFPT